jgi:hypothetical protein
MFGRVKCVFITHHDLKTVLMMVCVLPLKEEFNAIEWMSQFLKEFI